MRRWRPCLLLRLAVLGGRPRPLAQLRLFRLSDRLRLAALSAQCRRGCLLNQLNQVHLARLLILVGPAALVRLAGRVGLCYRVALWRPLNLTGPVGRPVLVILVDQIGLLALYCQLPLYHQLGQLRQFDQLGLLAL